MNPPPPPKGSKKAKLKAKKVAPRKGGETPMTMTWDNLPGAEDVMSALGRRPSFHDAEIVSVHFVRDGTSTVSLALQDASGREDIVTLAFRNISYLDLHAEDEVHQNVIFDLRIEEAENGTTVVFVPCYGLAGHITASQVSIRPGLSL